MLQNLMPVSCYKTSCQLWKFVFLTSSLSPETLKWLILSDKARKVFPGGCINSKRWYSRLYWKLQEVSQSAPEKTQKLFSMETSCAPRRSACLWVSVSVTEEFDWSESDWKTRLGGWVLVRLHVRLPVLHLQICIERTAQLMSESRRWNGCAVKCGTHSRRGSVVLPNKCVLIAAESSALWTLWRSWLDNDKIFR